MGNLIWICFLTINCVEAKIFYNIISEPGRNWIFLEKFVFDTSGQGTLSYSVQFPQSTVLNTTSNNGLACLASKNNSKSAHPCFQSSSTSASLLFYNNVDGSASSWFSVYNDESLTCEERASRAATQIPLDESGILNEMTLAVLPSAVPHFWYVVLSRCSTPSLSASVRLHFLNSQVLA